MCIYKNICVCIYTYIYTYVRLAVRQVSPASATKLKRHVSHLNASWHAQARVMSRCWMSHGTHTYRNWLLPRMNESCHTYAGTEQMCFEWKLSWHTQARVVSCIWMSDATHLHELTGAVVLSLTHTGTYCCYGVVWWMGCATLCNALRHTATHCNTLQHAATHELTVAVVLFDEWVVQHVETHCITLLHTATHYNTL